jgi:hypothetical protein
MPKEKADKPEVTEVPIRWRKDVADHDYAAAEAYLSLKLPPATVDKAVTRLRKAKLSTRRANDILRAAGLSPAPLDDPGVLKDLVRVIEGKELSPVLVLGGSEGTDIADGFHRVSLVYRIDPYGAVPLKLADAPRPRSGG